jgi:hypothetical protein
MSEKGKSEKMNDKQKGSQRIQKREIDRGKGC